MCLLSSLACRTLCPFASFQSKKKRNVVLLIFFFQSVELKFSDSLIKSVTCDEKKSLEKSTNTQIDNLAGSKVSLTNYI